ncbi:26S proteasome regulatory subunit, S6a family AAA ATpase, partial [Toxoplasma gondii GAB2-2007-GAL-DOM2]
MDSAAVWSDESEDVATAELAGLSASDLRMRTSMIDSEVRILKSEVNRLRFELHSMQVRDGERGSSRRRRWRRMGRSREMRRLGRRTNNTSRRKRREGRATGEAEEQGRWAEKVNKERIKDNREKIRLNRQLPYLVANVVELFDSEDAEEEEEDGAVGDIDAQRKGKCVVIKTSTRQ